MRSLIHSALIVTVASLCNLSLTGQTCCSGGVPVSGHIGFSQVEPTVLQLAAGYDFNYLNSLYSAGERLDDKLRKRVTNSLILRGGYQISNSLSGEVFIPYINQRREIRTNSNEIDKESGNGIGDIVMLLTYNIFNRGIYMDVSGGIKFPTGSNNRRNDDGLLLVNDLQPGSNSLDFVFRTAMGYSLKSRPTVNIYVSGIFTLKGSNDVYLGSQQYIFGDDFQVLAGISDELLLRRSILMGGLGFRYRKAERDEINSNKIDSTGGKWLFSRFTSGIALSPSSRIVLHFEWPLITFVNGTQVSPSYVLNINFQTQLKLKK